VFLGCQRVAIGAVIEHIALQVGRGIRSRCSPQLWIRGNPRTIRSVVEGTFIAVELVDRARASVPAGVQPRGKGQ
jgi:hypothetical protein